jgi:hypothetical protein
MPLGWRSEIRQTVACKESAQNERLYFHAANVADVAIRDDSFGSDEDYLALRLRRLGANPRAPSAVALSSTPAITLDR